MGGRFGWGSEALPPPQGVSAASLPAFGVGGTSCSPVVLYWLLRFGFPRNRNGPPVLDESLKDSSLLVGDPKTNEV